MHLLHKKNVERESINFSVLKIYDCGFKSNAFANFGCVVRVANENKPSVSIKYLKLHLMLKPSLVLSAVVVVVAIRCCVCVSGCCCRVAVTRTQCFMAVQSIHVLY